MDGFRFNVRTASIAALRLSVLALVIALAACVTPTPLGDRSPKMSYQVSEKVTVVVIDSRPILKAEKKPATFIGHVHSIFGIPVDMQVYPWAAPKEEKLFTLAQELEQRIAESLQAIGANVIRIEPGAHADAVAAKSAAQRSEADRILLITLDEWYVDANLNWVGTFELNWGYSVEISDQAGAKVAVFIDSGQDIVKLHGSDSWPNQIAAAFRERLQKLLERPDVHSALNSSKS